MNKYLLRGFAIFGVLALLWWLYGMAVPEAIEIPPERLSVDLPAESYDSAVTLAANLDAPLLEGNRVELLVNGIEIFPAMLSSIREARQSVNMLSYVYWTGDIAREFADELSAAARRGVEVRVLIDAFGGRTMDPALVQQMQHAGCRFARFHPFRWYNLRRWNNRTHRKVLVVDGRIGFTGGVGIASEWTGDAQGPRQWRDDHFRIEGPAVRYLQGAFAENWRQASAEVLAGERMFPPLAPAGAARMVPLNAAPQGSISDIAFVYWLLFHSAHEKVRIATPYFAPDPELELGVQEAARRGVEVTLLVPGPHQDAAVVGYASRTYYRRLLKAGVRIFEYQPTMMHTKTVTVDNTWAVIGSSNFDSRSFELNYEIAVAVYDRPFVEALNASYTEDLSESTEITLADVEQWSIFARARDRIALLLREQL
ncbi:MAG: cardiolipin synthase B [Gammaproteobacteria bacterium]|nr:cardiolipin synthase B [Gammaproteobacteria bacterium]